MSNATGTATETGTIKGFLFRLVGPRTFACARSLLRLARDDWHAPYPLSHRLRAWWEGFYADSYIVYDIAHHNPADYINDYTWAYRCSRLNDSLTYFRHKLSFRSVLLHAGFKQPETVALIAGERILRNPLSPNSRYVSDHEFESFLRSDGGRFVVKPEAGNRGAGIFLLDASDENLIHQRGSKRRPFRCSDLPSVGLVERMVQQGPFWSALNPSSANTLRLLTGWMPGEARPFVIRAVQRIGTAETAPTDNWSGGSLSALVDLRTGSLGPGRVHQGKSRLPPQSYTVHPESKAQIDGATLPNWDEIQDVVLRACMCSPMHRYIGWDVLVDDQDDPIVLEANGNSGIGMLQVHGGLLTDPAARRYYEACHVI